LTNNSTKQNIKIIIIANIKTDEIHYCRGTSSSEKSKLGTESRPAKYSGSIGKTK
jgi:hypothetical protein